MYLPRFLLSCFIFVCFFTSCEKRARFNNFFDGGSFSMTVYDCDNEDLLHGETEIIKRTKHSISIKYLGACLYDHSTYTFEGKSKVKKDSIILIVETDSRINPGDEGEGEEASCVCPCEMVFSFDEAVSQKDPYEIRWKEKKEKKKRST